MSDIFNQIGFKPGVQVTPQVAPQAEAKTEQVAASTTVEKQDSVELSNKQPKEKKGLFGSIKSGIASIKKTFATIGAYTSGTIKGLKNAAIGGSLVFTGGTVFNAINQKKVARLGEEAAKKAKSIPTKALAIATGALAFGASLFTAHLNANEASSNIDHRWTGHDK